MTAAGYLPASFSIERSTLLLARWPRICLACYSVVVQLLPTPAQKQARHQKIRKAEAPAEIGPFLKMILTFFIARQHLEQRYNTDMSDNQEQGYALVNVLKSDAFQYEHIIGSINIRGEEAFWAV